MAISITFGSSDWVFVDVNVVDAIGIFVGAEVIVCGGIGLIAIGAVCFILGPR